MKSSAEYFHLIFLKKEKITTDVFGFYFSRKDIKFNFLAGQYVHMYLPIENEKGRGNSRMFTIASSPLDKDHILIVTRKGRSLFKKTLFKLIPQTPVKFYGPSGSLVIDENPPTGGKPYYVFLAPGIGITPFVSIIKYISQKNINIPIALLASFSKKEDFLFYDELNNIAKSNSNIKIVYVPTRINEKLVKKHVKDINKHLYYIIGPAYAIASLEEVVSGMGVASENIFLEDFEGY